MFVHILPYIGTEDAALFIRDLILNEEISESDATTLLQKFPNYIHKLSKNLISQLEILVENDNGLSEKVYSCAVLSYSYLISKMNVDSRPDSDEITKRYVGKLNKLLEGIFYLINVYYI